MTINDRTAERIARRELHDDSARPRRRDLGASADDRCLPLAARARRRAARQATALSVMRSLLRERWAQEVPAESFEPNTIMSGLKLERAPTPKPSSNSVARSRELALVGRPISNADLPAWIPLSTFCRPRLCWPHVELARALADPPLRARVGAGRRSFPDHDAERALGHDVGPCAGGVGARGPHATDLRPRPRADATLSSW